MPQLPHQIDSISVIPSKMGSLKCSCVVDLLILLASLTICSSLMVATSSSPPPHTGTTINDPKLHTRVDAVHQNGCDYDGYDYPVPDYLCPPLVTGNPWPPTSCHCEPIYCGNQGDCQGWTMHFTYPIQATGASKANIMHDDAAAMAPESA